VPGIVLEGGAVEGDGQGTVLTTEECLFNQNRNPGMSRGDVENYLRDYLVAKKVIWLGSGIAGDDTDGHIDELARFVAPGVVVAAVEDNVNDDNFAPLKDNYHRLSRAIDAAGRRLEIVRIPMPSPIFYDDQRLPASYMNFYIANGLVVVPTFDDPADQFALDTLGKLFPGREVRGLNAIDMAWGLGAFHCITQQQPA